MSDLHTPTIHERNEDGTDVHVSCDCGEWEFRGDWDDMCQSWFEHERDPEWDSIHIARSTKTFWTREAGKKYREIVEEKRRDREGS